ncbi:hypothetical protein IJ843_06650 [bacterium]|nr:hypothetical protein [bacterium]
MYSGTNVILVTNNETMIGLLSSELVQLRNIDSILIRNYQDTLATVESEKPQAVIINCQNSIEEPFCLDLIKKIKNISSVPIILLVENYNSQFIRIANKAGISDVLSIQYGNSEILMRTIWSLQKNELRQQHKKYEKLLTQLNAIDEKTGFYTSKYSSKVFQNEIDYLASKQIDGVIIALEPNKNSRLKPSTANIIETIKNNVRATDTVAHTKSQNTFYLLLANTNLEGSMVVWNRLNKNIGADETLCGCIYVLDNSPFEEIETELKEGLIKSQTAPNLLYIIEPNSKQSDDWLGNETIQTHGTNKDFKLFRQVFAKKLEKVIKPAIDELLKEYEDVLSNTEVPLVETENSYSVKFVNKRQESEFSITQEGNTLIINSVHNGLDSPENKTYTIGLNEVTTREINNDFEDFILEFKSCL